MTAMETKTGQELEAFLMSEEVHNLINTLCDQWSAEGRDPKVVAAAMIRMLGMHAFVDGIEIGEALSLDIAMLVVQTAAQVEAVMTANLLTQFVIRR